MQDKEKYTIEYNIEFDDDSKFYNKKIKIKNCMSILHAKVKLEGYLKKKYPNFKKLIVINCEKDYFDLGSMLGMDINI